MMLYQATVPVFRHKLAQISATVEKVDPAMLEHRLADALPVREQFAVAAGFSLRITAPLAGREVPDLPAALGPRLAVARALLGSMKPQDFDGAEGRMIRHRAGEADLWQPAEEFVHLFGLPNFFFHMVMGYAALRAAGAPLGKADFDGYHLYKSENSAET